MKNRIVAFAVAVIASTLVEGCGNKTSKLSNESRLTAAELAELMDCHAWNVPIPQSLQPVKRVRLVIVKADGTVVPKFDTMTSTLPEACSFFVVGFRVEGGAFKGHFNARDSKGGGMGWPLQFKDAFADSNPGWVIGEPSWKGNRAELAEVSTMSVAHESILAIELLK